MDSLLQVLNAFLVQAQKGGLKTSAYPKEWNDLKMKVSFGDFKTFIYLPIINFVMP